VPTYEYACRSCGTHVEVYQRFSDPPLTECGVCGGPLRKVFHPAGILFKGSGFYATDSRRSSSSRKEGAKGEGGGSGETAAASSGSATDTGKDKSTAKDTGPKATSTKEKSA
jgi:putative FmdB family regulatory protein